MPFAHPWKFSLALCLTPFLCFADDLNSQISSLDTRVNAVKIETPKQTTGAQMVSANPLYDGYGLFLTADVLFWHLYEGGSDYSLSRNVSGPESFPEISAKSSRVHFDWDWGFRVGAGYRMEHDGWEAYANFTWFQTDGSGHARAKPGQSLILEKGSLDSVTATKINADWDVHDYVIDLELGRRFFVSKFLALRPEFGIETAWMRQHRRFGMSMPLDQTTLIEGEIVRGTCHFWGIGPRAGIEGTWYFCNHMSLVGAFNGALLWGEFKTRQKEKNITPSGPVPSLNAKEHFHRVVPNVQTAIGLSWDSNFAQDRCHLGIKLSYEFQYWWRQNQFLNEQQLTIFGLFHESKDLALNGVTLNIALDF